MEVLDKSENVWYTIIEEYYTIIPYLDLPPPFAYMANLCRFWGLRHSAFKILKRKSIIKLNKKSLPPIWREGTELRLPRERSKMNFNLFSAYPCTVQKE